MAEEEGDKADELQVYADFLRIVLEILNCILATNLPTNPELVYAMLHQQEIFMPFQVALFAPSCHTMPGCVPAWLQPAFCAHPVGQGYPCPLQERVSPAPELQERRSFSGWELDSRPGSSSIVTLCDAAL